MNRLFPLLVLVVLVTGCDARVMMTANLVVAVVPCALLWLTLNLSKER